MQLFPPVALLLFGGWILVAVYVVINFAIPALAPGALKRLLTNPFPDKSLSARIRGGIEMVTWFGTLALVLIYPLQTQSNVFGAGLILYCVGMVFTAISLWNYTFTPPDTPVTAGVYRFSRNPIYVVSVRKVLFSLGLMKPTGDFSLKRALRQAQRPF